MTDALPGAPDVAFDCSSEFIKLSYIPFTSVRAALKTGSAVGAAPPGGGIVLGGVALGGVALGGVAVGGVLPATGGVATGGGGPCGVAGGFVPG